MKMNSWLSPAIMQLICYCSQFYSDGTSITGMVWVHLDISLALVKNVDKCIKMYLFYQKNMCQGQVTVAPAQVPIGIIWNLFLEVEVTSLVNPWCCSGNGLRANRIKEFIESYTFDRADVTGLAFESAT